MMTNKLRRIFCPTPEEDREDMLAAYKLHRQSVEKKWCSSCIYFYDNSYGPGIDYGCKLPDHDQYAISHEDDCPDWEEEKTTVYDKYNFTEDDL